MALEKLLVLLPGGRFYLVLLRMCLGMLWRPGKERRGSHKLSPFVRKALQISAQKPWKINSEFLVALVPADTPVLGSVPLLHLGKGNVAVCRRASVCHGGVWSAGGPVPQRGPGQSMYLGAGSWGLMVRETQSCLLLCLAPSQLSGQRLEHFHSQVPVPGKLSAACRALQGCHDVGLGSRWPLWLLLEELMVNSAFHLPVKAESALTHFLSFPSSSWLFWRTTQIPLMRHRWQVARQGWRR